MISVDVVTTESLRDALAEVEGKKPTQRVMAAINYFKEDDATMAEVSESGMDTPVRGSHAGLIGSTGSSARVWNFRRASCR